ncbi:MAG: glycoside hydrolase, partial [Kineothrix sp.]|nr:glycoside hydrolase [Kineothrix sp.]
MNGYQKILNRPVQNCLYPFFWQHGEEHTILGEYVQKIYESGMRALCIEARPHPDFVGEGWWKDMRFILSECKKRGMKIWILDDSHFPTGYVNGRIKADYPE